MFRRTFPFWSSQADSGAPSADDDSGQKIADSDRRIWVRYPAQVETVVQHAQSSSQKRLPAIIYDISQGGARFEVDEALEEGSMITLDLPTSRGTESVLACVVRVGVTEDAMFEIGCVFSQELSRDELESLGAEHEEPDGSDQRKWVRFACPIGASFYRIDEDESASRDAQVLNVSANGVGLVVDEAIENGILLNIDLKNEAGDVTQSILACVVHVLQRDDGRYALGCNFIRELSEHDLLALR